MRYVNQKFLSDGECITAKRDGSRRSFCAAFPKSTCQCSRSINFFYELLTWLLPTQFGSA
ncbi:hypothetical protein L798_08376 [Zootermopsis nevadensis]|uniref:Uncharacterized protein n=1 Tax=Zootermopsis nevadensis TaxID=136037 RepID=A0A067RBD7_ZOONE|nr:hypothetical protein L798_08376 [Zootermopsis nevadensis]